ncbi:MAG: hypothetical protein ACD_79C00759G0001, partial [uncultured bacterium]
LENVVIKAVGSNDEVMLEGSVSNNNLSKYAEEITKLYIPNVFNIISVKPVNLSLSLYIAEINFSNPSLIKSRYVDTLIQSRTLNSPCHFLLFDQTEMDSYKKELKDNLQGNFLNLSAQQTDESGMQSIIFQNSKASNFKLTFKSYYMDNGFYGTDLALSSDDKTLFNKTIYCRKGEWVSLSGLLKNETDNSDLVIVFSPANI